MEEINIKKDKNIKMGINKNKFRFELTAKIELVNDEPKSEGEEEGQYREFPCIIKKVIELSEDKLGILYEIEYEECLFLIYSSKTFARIKKFENHFLDVVKIKDNNLVLCDKNNVYFYKLIKKRI